MSDPIEFERDGKRWYLECKSESRHGLSVARATDADLRAAGYVPQKERDDVAVAAVTSHKQQRAELEAQHREVTAERDLLLELERITRLTAPRVRAASENEALAKLDALRYTKDSSPSGQKEGNDASSQRRDSEVRDGRGREGRGLQRAADVGAVRPAAADEPSRATEAGGALASGAEEAGQVAKDPRAAGEEKLERVAHELACYQAGWSAAMARCGHSGNDEPGGVAHPLCHVCAGPCAICALYGEPVPTPAAPAESGGETEPVCRWCRKTLEEHMASDLPDRPRARCPCLGWRENFVPRAAIEPAKPPADAPITRAELTCARCGRLESHGVHHPGISVLNKTGVCRFKALDQ